MSDGIAGDQEEARINEVMCGFGKDMWAWIKEHGESVFEVEEVDDIMEIATRYGLAKKVAYDPEIHKNIHNDDYLEKGDQIWWYGDGV